MSDPSSPQDIPEGPLTPSTRTTPVPGTRPLPRDPATGPADRPADKPIEAEKPRLSPPTGTRASYTWLALTAAAIALVLLIIFILQNTQTVTVTFLWFQGSLPLAVALLIAGAATLILTLAVGAARILQLRRFSRKAAKRGNKLAATKP